MEPILRIHLFGASGSGCTSLGRDLAGRLGLRFVDADDFYWVPSEPPYRVRVAAAQRNANLLRTLADHESWVLSGSITPWGMEPLPRFTLAVFVYVARGVRGARLQAREQERYGTRVRPGADMHETSRAFLRWADGYESGELPGRSLPQHMAWHASLGCAKLCFDNAASFPEASARLLGAVRSCEHYAQDGFSPRCDAFL